MGFFSDLGNVINEQFAFGENTVNSLDTRGKNGRVQNFGLLGDFANKFDRTAERSYIEDGFIRNVRPRMREILWQEPNVTIVIKKRMFSSLTENFRLDLMNDEEKLFLRASKRLFQNKCRTIAAYERLSKIERVARETGQLNSFMIPSLLDGFSVLDDAGLTGFVSNKTRSAIETLRKVFTFSEPTGITTWMIDNQTPFMSEIGEGTGVFDLTTVASLNTTISTDFGGGNASLNIESPYKLLTIDNEDIERAISDASSTFRSGGFGRLTEIETQRLIERQKTDLNSIRQARGASPIRFITSPDTLISSRVRAVNDTGQEIKFQFNSGLVGIGSSVEIDPTEFTDQSQAPEGVSIIGFAGPNGLTRPEARLFREIIKNTFLLLGFLNTSRQEQIQFNESTNYVRRKMRLHFGGRYIIQPMDIINIFVSSKTMEDDRLTAGFELQSRGLTIGQKLDSLVRNINTTLSNLSGDVGQSWEEVEKTAIVGPDFPTWLWRLFRNDFTRQSAGTAVFVGLVSNVKEDWNDGKYRLNVSCEDNAGYFNKSQINLRPAVDVFNSTLYDPVTPFKISFDEATGTVLTDAQNEFPELLDENVLLLNSAAVRFKNGRFRGNKISEELYKAKNINIEFNSFTNVLNDPDGFVYRWKEGIGSLTKTERAVPEASIRDERSPLLTSDPFAGQDVMNVLSFLCTGQPYNYNTFLKAAIANGNAIASKNTQTNSDVAVSYIEGLANDLAKRNSVWGNFVPFKKIVLSDDAENFVRTGDADLLKLNQRILSLVQQRASLQDDLILLKRGFAIDPQQVPRDELGQPGAIPDGSSLTTSASNLEQQIAALDREIDDARRRFDQTITEQIVDRPLGNIKIIGDDISLDPSNSDTQTALNERQRKLSKEEFRRRLDFLTLRRVWKVRSNDDPNLFIVDDQYDKNFDIQGFERRIGGKLNLFESEYTTVDSKIKQIAELLGLEIFADSQGHIQARPPGYNKVPSSVFFRMFREKHEKGIQVFPQFLESLFFNQLQGIASRVEILEDEIRIRTAALGAKDDSDAENILNQRMSSASQFRFITNRSTGRFDNELFNNFVAQSRPEFNENILNNGLKPISNTFAENASKFRLFDVTSRVDLIRDENFFPGISHEGIQDLDEIRRRLRRKRGGNVPTLRQLFSSDRFKRLDNQFSQTDALNILNQIAGFVSERQDIILQAVNVIRNLQEGAVLNQQNKGVTTALFPQLNRKQEIPGILEHIIEDENNDDIGFNSGKRYIIKENQIISLSIEEAPPPFTLVQVNGLFGEGFVDPASGLRLTSDGPGGGNAITSAFAVDYDMWRMYGFRSTHSVPAPFFDDPDAQCAPYAVYLLNLARKDILRGSITLAGNEFYQAGDVVYLEDRDLLFYVTSVNHSFDYGGNFTTTLTLRYGHTPGEYIPTILDIVGKVLYNNRQVSTRFRSQRFGNANGDIPVGSLVFNNNETPNLFAGSGIENLLSGPRGEQNKKVLGNTLLSLSGALNPVELRRVRPILEFRVYTNTGTQGVVNDRLLRAAESARAWVINPQSQSITNQNLILASDEETKFVVSPENVRVVVIDFSTNTKEIAFPPSNNVIISTDVSPSGAAWNTVRDLRLDPVPNIRNIDIGGGINQDDIILYNQIIDAWVTFESIEDSIETGKNQSSLNQNIQNETDEINNARKKFSE